MVVFFNFGDFLIVFVKSDITTHYGTLKGVLTRPFEKSRIATMKRTLATFFCSMAALLVVSCGPESTGPQTRNLEGHGDIMDVSTWNFEEERVMRGQATHSTHLTGVQTHAKDQYAIVVATFTGAQHEQSALATRAQLIRQYPLLGRGLRVRQRSRGTALSYGDYTGYDDSNAKKDIVQLRLLRTPQSQPLFAQVLLMKFKAVRQKKDIHPFDLWIVRREFPTRVPIFTLEVAIWGDFDSGQFPQSKRRAAAEGYATELRKKGFESYFYHNDDAGLSSVTVGLFGNSAVDAETGFYSHEVEAMLRRFPIRLVNGQEVQVYFDPAHPTLGSSVQPPCLAEVPVD